MTITGWSESKEDAAMRWEKTQAIWYAAEQLKASEITEVEAIELGAALRNAALLDAETVTDLTRAAYMEAQDLPTQIIAEELTADDWMTEARAQMADSKDLERTQEDARL